ncbi:MAG: DNA polymerase III subunit delta [Gammaproteobacteria bacterium]
MRLQAPQLPAALKKGLSPVYFITGDEPLQLAEAADAVRAAAKKAGYASREILTVDPNFEWARLSAEADTLSLFADKKIIDLRLPSGKPGADGAKALTNYCARIPQDTLLLVTGGKLESAALKSQWFQSLDRAGTVIQVWPLSGRDLLQWLDQRVRQRGMTIDQDGLRLLCARVEGNLLAAAQEIEKLYVLYGAAALNVEAIESAVADSSHYDVFDLCDTMLEAKVAKLVKVMQGLKAEGVAEPIVLWALTREARTLCRIKTALSQGANKAAVFTQNQVRGPRQRLIEAALSRLSLHRLDKVLLMSAKADRQIKGRESGDPWATLLDASLMMAGVEITAKTN